MSFFFQVLVLVSINIRDTHYISNTFIFEVEFWMLPRFWRGECHLKPLDDMGTIMHVGSSRFPSSSIYIMNLRFNV